MPAISVVTVTIESGKELAATVESVLKQDYTDWELIIKSGIKETNSLSELFDDPRVRVIQSPDSGIYDAMNQGLNEARGRYVNFLNVGDKYTGKSVLRLVADNIAGGEPSLIYGDCYHRATGKEIHFPSYISRKFCYLGSLCHQVQWWKRELLTETGGFDLSYPIRADHDLLMRCFVDCGWSNQNKDLMSRIPEVLVDYEGAGFSGKKENRNELDNELRALRRKHFSRWEHSKLMVADQARLIWLKRWIKDLAGR